MSDKGKGALATLKGRLLALRDEVTELSQGHADDSKTVEVDSAIGRLSRMDALQQQAIAQEAARRRDLELHKIDAALERLKEDEFGYCLACGEEIGSKRLDLDPTVTVCINCARDGEKHH